MRAFEFIIGRSSPLAPIKASILRLKPDTDLGLYSGNHTTQGKKTAKLRPEAPPLTLELCLVQREYSLLGKTGQ